MDVDLNELLLGRGAERKMPLGHSIDKDARFLVTGGAGSIGRELTLQLLYNGASNVAIFDNSDERLRKVKKKRFLQNFQKGFMYFWVMCAHLRT